ncbi:DUF6415 family natural product biosynthesis protein [Streptomyces sp. NBC_01351]|uniref:DUF6415 family natural product biosynthesis protein n=1 Tax=Streptomyces sp. NBC_01351 TaxID=2903833 RepID=UPI002E34723E|nr:DUF6415 family natural product biosynthesis protein [Streptomyces sp. NBC_01351]
MTTTPDTQQPVLADAVRALCARVLTPDTYRIPGSEVRQTTALLQGYVRLLLGEKGDVSQACTDAERLLSHGPGEGRLGAWIHMRALARVCRVLLIERQVRQRRNRAAADQAPKDPDLVVTQ